MTRAFLIATLALAFLLPSSQAWAKKDPAKAITDGIICPCSCGEILTGCTCETGKAMRAYVDTEVKGGKSKDQIEAALVSQYGEVILGAPKAKGFNTVVWVAPFAATAVGIFIATFVLNRWVRRRNVAALEGPTAGVLGSSANDGAKTHLDTLRARAEDELQRLRE